ncbi:metallophosphoesterase [Atopococcus tabaci]|uniref:metallophosphoesterase n=1 Tax=Atopococcus tabaci TaxID=269774 RepID=UPI002408FE4A|nr:metallophosphoesterase [Atopococcus tabaci]
MAVNWTDNMRFELARLVEQHTKDERIDWQTIKQLMNHTFGERFTRASLRMQHRDYIQGRRVNKLEAPEANEKPVLREKDIYKEKLEYTNGQWQSDKLIEMSDEQKKDPAFLLEAHGFDADEWELVNARSSLWHQRNKKDQFNDNDKPVLLYSNKITVRPKQTKVNWNQIIANIKQATEPLVIESEYIAEQEKKYLAVMLNDMHFGNNTYDDYIETQQEIVNLLENGYHQVLFIIGSDLFHHNDLRNRTASGREIEHMDMAEAWEHATHFYEPLLKWAAKKAYGVECVYVRGNHDESLSWAFSKYLQGRFPQVWFNNDLDFRKVTMLGNNMIGMAHGDKAVKDLPMLMATEFPKEWAMATTRECFIGHLHSEKTTTVGSEDIQGMTIRRTPTGNKADTWHKEHGYTMAHRRFQCVEYTENEVAAIYYV